MIIDKQVIYDTATSRELTHEQKLMAMAKCAENCLENFTLSARAEELFASEVIRDLYEGNTPYRPRYILPDYDKFMKQGSKFLKTDAPTDLDEALFALITLYRHVPSVTNFPVYLGNLDRMLDPFLDGHTDEEIIKKLRLVFTYLDRTITDSFCHANLGPEDSRAARLILEAEEPMINAVPNFTIKYDPQITPDELMEKAISCSLKCSNPAIANHAMCEGSFGDAYGVASCYNILPTCGGAYTLTRLTMPKLAQMASSVENFMNELLPEAVAIMCDYMAQRIKFMVEQSGFFESNFLVKEGLISADRFLGMFGLTGLAECVNILLKVEHDGYGHSKEAEELATQILERTQTLVDTHHAPYSPLTGGKFLLHAQVGLDRDDGVTSGVRIPVGDEPCDFFDHLRHSAKLHGYFPTGVGDIFPIATNVSQNTSALLDVVKGAFGIGVRYLSFYAADTDLVRITGYLVKRSEMEKWENHEAVLHNTTQLGSSPYHTAHLGDRKVRMG